MIRIAYLLGGFQGGGGIARVTSILENELSNTEGFEFHAISYVHQNKPDVYYLNDKIKKHFLLDTPASMTKAILFKHIIKKLKSIIVSEKIDVLVCCDAIHFPFGILACRGTKTKCLCWEHTSPVTSDDHRFQNSCRSFGVKSADKFIVLTKYAEDYYAQKFPKYKNKILQIYNPIARNSGKSSNYDMSAKKIISVGRLSYQKNFERLITIAAKVLPKYPDWEWHIYGEGPLHQKLKDMINENNIGNQLKLMGQATDLYERYKSYAFVVMTSRYEGFPMSLIEAIANRLPMISFDILTGPNEIINNGVNGFLIDSESDEDMIDKIEKLITEPETRIKMSKKSFQTAELFSLERIVGQWLQLFREIVNPLGENPNK